MAPPLPRAGEGDGGWGVVCVIRRLLTPTMRTRLRKIVQRRLRRYGYSLVPASARGAGAPTWDVWTWIRDTSNVRTIIDIGANIGAHTLSLARSAGPSGKVYAFEPSDFGFAKLRRNLALNPELEARTVARQILLSASGSDPAERLIYASWPLQSVDPVHPKHRGRLVPADHAIVDTLDDFVDRERISRLDTMPTSPQSLVALGCSQ